MKLFPSGLGGVACPTRPNRLRPRRSPIGQYYLSWGWELCVRIIHTSPSRVTKPHVGTTPAAGNSSTIARRHQEIAFAHRARNDPCDQFGQGGLVFLALVGPAVRLLGDLAPRWPAGSPAQWQRPRMWICVGPRDPPHLHKPGLGSVVVVLHNKNPPTPCLWQAPASTQKTKRKTRPAIRRSARWRAKGWVRVVVWKPRSPGWF